MARAQGHQTEHGLSKLVQDLLNKDFERIHNVLHPDERPTSAYELYFMVLVIDDGR